MYQDTDADFLSVFQCLMAIGVAVLYMGFELPPRIKIWVRRGPQRVILVCGHLKEAGGEAIIRSSIQHNLDTMQGLAANQGKWRKFMEQQLPL